MNSDVKSRGRLLWAGRIAAFLILVGLIWYLASVGLDKADKLASVVAALVAVASLLGPLLARPRRPEPSVSASVVDSGSAIAERGGKANSGAIKDLSSGSVTVERSGNVVAKGDSSVANSGVYEPRETE